MNEKPLYQQSADEALIILNSSKEGLSEKEAGIRLSKYGLNNYKPPVKISILEILLEQIINPLILILVIIAVLNILADRKLDFGIIISIVIINTLIGFYQEYKSRKAVSSLNLRAPEYVRVLRNEELTEILSQEIVPGDIILLEAGEKISADGRLIEVNNLRIDESILTGESLPTSKDASIIKFDSVIANRKNMVFAGTIVTSGNARMIVSQTGIKTEFGVIAKTIASEETPKTTLEIQIEQFTSWIIKIVSVIALIIFALSIFRQHSILSSIAMASAVAVSAIPEGLPAIITITLSFGVMKIAQKKAVMQDMEAVATLGQISIIATDKTGTLTKNELTVTHCLIGKHIFEFTGDGYIPQGKVFDETKQEITNNSELIAFLRLGTLCNSAELIYETKDNQGWKIIGDPTEGSLVVAAEKLNIKHDIEREKFKKVDEIPFSTKTRLMATLHKEKDSRLLIIKGAPEVILNLSSHFSQKSNNTTIRKDLTTQYEKYAQNGYRVLALAVKKMPDNCENIDQKDLSGLSFKGFFIMEDAPREGAREAIQKAYKAGIRVVMITGDNPLTAKSIATQVGINCADTTITGDEINKMSESELTQKISTCNIFSRISPLEKLRLVKNLQKNNQIVAVTGDGINDAPSIKSANVGIAMGKSGTAISREAASMVILDDHFQTIIAAIEEGRIIFQNIKRVIFFLLSTNAGEVAVTVVALLIGLPLPITPIQILFINLFTDTFNTIPLVYEKGHSNLMQRPPRKLKSGFLDGGLNTRIVLITIWMVVITLPLFSYYAKSDVVNAKSFAFAVVCISQLFNVFNAQNLNSSLFKFQWIKNPLPLFTVIISLILTYFLVENPLMQEVFKTSHLLTSQWLIVMLLSFSVIIVVEIHKFLRIGKDKI